MVLHGGGRDVDMRLGSGKGCVRIRRRVLLVRTAQMERIIRVTKHVSPATLAVTQLLGPHPAHPAPPLPAFTVPPAHRQRLEPSALWTATVQAALKKSKIAPLPQAITARQGLRRLLE